MWVLLGSLTSAQHPHLNDLQEANVSPIKASKLKKKKVTILQNGMLVRQQ